jgi:DNA mismatch repair protein MutL
LLPEGVEPAWMPLRPPEVLPSAGAAARPGAPPPVRAELEPRAVGLSQLRYIGQLASTFLLLEDEDGLVIVDQHVAHERVRVEELLEGARSGRQAVQPLLVPAVVELPPAACLALERSGELLLALGFEVDVLGAGSVAVRSAPAALPLAELEETVRLLARRLQDEDGPPPDPAELLEETLVMAACKGAIKAHDPLTPEQARALLQKLDRARHPFSCPHGRPAYFRLPLGQIEREFGRLGFA